ncbi:hypothetical protein PLICRDRAFT_137774 [Plicaturopsis crispa FD-325 SS-3]|nr:hypothetical protein PLICRDRAFT_137774 [Plicaturopsis crispa FD-325 SS-3]
MATNPRILSLQGKGLKLDTRADLAPHLAGYDPAVVEEIHFGGNTIGVDASKALAEFLDKATSLKIADFADIFTGRLISEIPDALSAICDALKDKTSLVELDLSDNAFGGRSVDPMVPFLTHNRSFKVFKLNNNGLGPAGGAVIANALLESARLSKAEGKKSNLHTVICGRNRLESGSADAWAAAFAAHETLVDVRMPQNGIRMDGITALARGLSKCVGLEHLDLQDNTFTENGSETGVKAWAEALPLWPGLQILNLSDCVLSNDGETPAIIAALAAGSNPKLHTLQLQNNNLEAQTFALLSSAAALHLRSVMKLELQWNEAEEDDESLETLAATLKQRGGKLFVSDEDEDDEEEDRREAEEDAADAEETNKSPAVGPATSKPEANPGDVLAELMSKVDIR